MLPGGEKRRIGPLAEAVAWDVITIGLLFSATKLMSSRCKFPERRRVRSDSFTPGQRLELSV